MRSLLTSFLLIICVLPNMAQFTLSGIVVDKITKEPLIGANILITNTKVGTQTDWDGSFVIDVTEPPISVAASYLGYEAVEITLEESQEYIRIELAEASVIVEGIEGKAKEFQINKRRLL